MFPHVLRIGIPTDDGTTVPAATLFEAFLNHAKNNNYPKQVMKNNEYQQTTSQVVAVDETEFLVPAWLSE